MDELEEEISVRITSEGVMIERTSSRAKKGGVWELWVKGLDFRLGRRPEISIAFT